MSQLGLGVMLKMLGGNASTVDAIKASLGKVIKSVVASESDLTLEFQDGSRLTLWDDGQSCCETRYMTCDDTDLSTYKGATLQNIEVVAGGEVDKNWEVHETQFLNIVTDWGTIQAVTHNEHNGYYGGFSIAARLR